MLYLFGSKSKITERNQFTTAKIDRLMRPKQLGLDENWYGGRVTKLAQVKDSALLILANDSNETIDTGVDSERIRELEPIELKQVMKLLGVKFDGKIGNKETLLSILDNATGVTPEPKVTEDAR